MTAQDIVRGDVAVLVPAAGLGTRLGPGAPKALRRLGDASLLVHAVRRLCLAPSVGHLVVAAPVADVDAVAKALASEVRPSVGLQVLAGGPSRQASVRAALWAVPAHYSVVLVHDAARAFAPPDLVERVAAAVREGHGAVIPVVPVVDTIKKVDQSGHVIDTVDRSSLRAVQTPQGFRREVIEAAHSDAVDDLTDDAGLAEKIGARVFSVPGSASALKITTPDDLAIAEALLRGGRLSA